MVFLSSYKKFLFFVLPPSAFVCLGVIIAAKNSIDDVVKQKQAAKAQTVQIGNKRVRTTGHIS